MKNDLINGLRFTVLFFFLSLPTFANALPSPVGLWKTFDLNHHQRSIVRLSLMDGKLVGTIVKNLTQSSERNPTCQACRGVAHGKPLVGLTIIWGLSQKGDAWKNGHVLDVDSGSIYKCNLSVSADNQVLNFSPYVGIPAFGTTLHWERI